VEGDVSFKIWKSYSYLCGLEEYRIPTSASNWWKDICALDKVMEGRNWIGDSLVRKVGNGNSTSFWKSRWIGDSSFSVMFPRLFSLSNHKESLVSEVGVNNGIRWCWHLSWRRPLFQWCPIAFFVGVGCFGSGG
jgi:hypothetical protein